MDERDEMLDLYNHIRNKYNGELFTVVFANTKTEPMLFIKLDYLNVALHFYTNSLRRLYEREGWDKLIEIVDTNLDKIIDMYGGW